MRIVVVASDAYVHLVVGCVTLINRHLPDSEIDILCFNAPTEALPANCSVVSMGKQRDFGTTWSTPLVPYFDTLAGDDYVVVMSCDHYILESDQERWRTCLSLVSEFRPQKLHLGRWDDTKNRVVHSELLYRWVPRGRWAMESWLDVAIWEVGYVRKLLRIPSGYWEFAQRTKRMARGLNPTILYFKESGQPFFYVDAYRRGESNRSGTLDLLDRGEQMTDYPGGTPRAEDVAVLREVL